MKEHLPISLERFAQLQAQVDAGARVDALLAEEGLGREAWRSAQRGWLARIGADSGRRRHELAQRYQRAYLEARPELLAAPAVEPAADDVDGTAMVFTIDAGDALPFAAAGEAKAPETLLAEEAPAAPEPEPSSVTAAAMVPRNAGDETQFVETLSALAPLPFAGAPQPDVEESALTVEQYASLCAERAAQPQNAPAIAQRYGLAAGQLAAVNTAWARRFEADPGLQQRFSALVAQYANWLGQNAGRDRRGR